MIGMNTFGNTVTRDQQQKQISFWNSNALGFTVDGVNPQNTRGIMAMAKQADGKIIVGGEFTKYNGVAVKQIVRLNANLTLDTSFDPVGAGLADTEHVHYNGFPLAIPTSIFTFSDGRIVLIYTYSKPYINSTATHGGIRSNAHPGFVILSSDGSLDSSHATYKNTYIEEWASGVHATMGGLGSANWGITAREGGCMQAKNDEFLFQGVNQASILHFTNTGTSKLAYEVGPSLYNPAHFQDIKQDSTGKLWAVGPLLYDLAGTSPWAGQHNVYYGGVWTWNSDGTRDTSTFRGGFYQSVNAHENYPRRLEFDSNDNLILHGMYGVYGTTGSYTQYMPLVKDGDTTKVTTPPFITVKQNGSLVSTVTNNVVINDPLDWTKDLAQFRSPSKFLRLDNGGWVIADNHDSATSLMTSTGKYHHTLVVVDSSGNTNANINGDYIGNSLGSRTADNFLFGPAGDFIARRSVINGIVQLDNDSILVGGKFTSYDGVDRNMIMQFNVTTGAIESPATY